MQFRKDINGLRAIAVLAVVLFHFNAEWLPGGFAGVDVFFVISGFLMTGIIVGGIDQRDFSVLQFYQSRAKRIVPALAVLSIILLIFGWFYLIPLEYAELAKHAGSSIGFFSNVVYLNEVGYFDLAAEQKWLLHTWSLSVEWQFYLIYPLLLVVISQLFSKSSIKYFVLCGAVLGYVYCTILTVQSPDTAYYSLATRVWEMLLGGVAFLFPLSLNSGVKKWLEWLAFTLMLCSFLLISEEYAWPGHIAIFPVFGAFLLIQAGRESSVLTGNGVFQTVGKWSYSIYLWHWPILVLDEKFSLNINLLLYLFLTTICAYISFKFFEQKVRIYTLSFLFSVTALFSFFVLSTSGVAERVDERYKLSRSEFHSQYYGGSGFSVNQLIYINSLELDYDLVFVGDSYGLQYAQSIKDAGISVAALFDHGCLIVPNYSRFLSNQEDLSCSEEYEKFRGVLKGNKKPVIIANSWDAYQGLLVKKGSNVNLKLKESEYFDLLSSEMDLIFRDNGIERQYYLIGVPQRSQVDAFECLARTQLMGYRLFDRCEATQSRQEISVNVHLNALAALYDNVEFIDPNEFLCTDNRCLLIKNREPIHTDKSHLSVYGAPIVVEGILRYMKEAEF